MRLGDFLHQGNVKGVSHPVITLTDSVAEFKPMPVCPCGLVILLSEEDGSDQCWKCKLLISTWLSQVEENFVLLTCFHCERGDCSFFFRRLTF